MVESQMLMDGEQSTTEPDFLELKQQDVGTKPTCDCPVHAMRGPLWALIGWLAAALGALSLISIPMDMGEDLCGVWGCLPTLQALVAVHSFWLVVAGACVWAIRRWLPRGLLPLGSTILVTAAIATAMIVGSDLDQWLQGVSASLQQFWPQRIGYTLAVHSELPMVQSMLAGLACMGLGLARRGKSKTSDPTPVEVQQ